MEIGRNDPCRCGSGKKYKKCCLEQDEQNRRDQTGGSESIESMRPIMGSRDTAEGSLRHKVVEFSDAMDSKHKHFLAAKEEWEGGDTVDYFGPDGGPRYVGLMDYFIHDYVIPSKDKCILDLFYDARRSELPAAELSILEEWLDNRRALYEVQVVRPGEGVDLQDLLTGAAYQVYDKSASRTLERWDILCARLMKCEGRWTMTGTAQPIQRRLKKEVVAYIQESLKALQTKDPSMTLERYLKTHSPEIKRFLEEVHEQNPLHFSTSTGEAITPTEIIFEITDLPVVRDCLGEMNDFACLGASSETPGGSRYDWLQRGASSQVTTGKPGTLRRGIQFISRMMSHPSVPDAPVLGNLTLTAHELRVSCLSQERMDLLTALLETRLGTLLRFKTSKRVPLAAMNSKERAESADIPEDIKREMMTKFFENYYREWKDKSIPSLDGLTPHQAARDPRGRLPSRGTAERPGIQRNAHEKRRANRLWGRPPAPGAWIDVSRPEINL